MCKRKQIDLCTNRVMHWSTRRRVKQWHATIANSKTLNMHDDNKGNLSGRNKKNSTIN